MLNQTTFDINTLTFDQDGLIPVVTQDVDSKTILMQAYMNKEALQKTLATQEAHYFSRKRQTLWKKGKTSGHTQRVISLHYDCDGDSLLLKVRQRGVACHTNQYSCFHNPIMQGEKQPEKDILFALFNLIKARKANPQKQGYTNYLFQSGLDKILKKVGEESSEVIIAAKNDRLDELRLETADLLYHLVVLLVEKDLPLNEIFKELSERMRANEKTDH